VHPYLLSANSDNLRTCQYACHTQEPYVYVPAYLVDLPLVVPLFEGVLQPGVVLASHARALRDAVVVLACEQSRGKGAPDGGSDVVRLLEDGEILRFKPLAMEHVVLGLLELGRLQT
jgi:hypothetical protein